MSRLLQAMLSVCLQVSRKIFERKPAGRNFNQKIDSKIVKHNHVINKFFLYGLDFL